MTTDIANQELLDRACAVGLNKDWCTEMISKNAINAVYAAITGVNRGMTASFVEQAARIDPQLLAVCVALQTKKQTAAPLGCWSAMASSGQTDLLGQRVRQAIAALLAACL